MDTLMALEAKQAPFVIQEQLKENDFAARKIGNKLAHFAPHMIMIIGRGSSDHAGRFAKYLLEVEIGLPTFNAAPSVASVYNKKLKLNQAFVIVISRSGRSPDILAQTKMAKEAGAYVIALVNDLKSPLAEMVDDVLALHAGVEKSVTPTKSYLATLSALLQLSAYWNKNQGLISALKTLPEDLSEVIDAPQQLTPQDLANTRNLVVLGRGLGFAIAKEIALKFKLVCSIHAEAFSSAEFLHGAVALVAQNITVVECLIKDESEQVHCNQIAEVESRGANILGLHQVKDDVHPRIAPLLVLLRFYLDVEILALAKGFNPDEPLGLVKVTETV